jgi:hypothetical protein
MAQSDWGQIQTGFNLATGARKFASFYTQREGNRSAVVTPRFATPMLTGILASAEPQSFGRGERLRDYMRAFARSLNMTST